MANRPNILFILTDDQGAWALGAAGNREIITPHLDRLASEGAYFPNFFCASPVCSPARASILTGLPPSQHGIHDWIRSGNVPADRCPKPFMDDTQAIEYLAGLPTYPQILADNGYVCGISGKWHLGDSLRPQQGFGYWHVIPYGGSPAPGFRREHAGRPPPATPRKPIHSGPVVGALRAVPRGAASTARPRAPLPGGTGGVRRSRSTRGARRGRADVDGAGDGRDPGLGLRPRLPRTLALAHRSGLVRRIATDLFP